MYNSAARINALLEAYRDPVALSRAIATEYLTGSEEERIDLAMAMAWHIATQVARARPA